ILDGLADFRLGTAQEALAVAKALGFRIETAIDDLHRFPSHGCAAEYAANSTDRKHRQLPAGADIPEKRGDRQCRFSLISSPACTTRPGAGPGGACNRAPSCAARTPRASSPS